MKILHVMAGGAAGGAEMAFVDLCIAQKQAGMDIITATRPNPQRNALLRDANVPIHEFPFGKWFDFKTTPGLKALIDQEKPDIVQCWMSRASEKCPNPGSTNHPFVKIARLGGYYNMKYYHGVSHFITNTPDIKRWLVDDQGRNAENVTHINNFAELAPVDTPVQRGDLDTPDDAFVFLAMARLHKVKGLDIAIEALSNRPNAILWIAGEGGERVSLENFANQCGVAERVRFLGWRTDRNALLQACDAVVFPSRFEPFGGTFAQAWAAKRPLVTTASQGPSQYVTNGENALMVDIDDTDALSAAMGRVMTDRALRAKLSENGYLAYRDQFTKPVVLAAYQNLYSKLANSQ